MRLTQEQKDKILSISVNNRKLGDIPSLSVMPGITCRADAPCKDKGCYAMKMMRYANVRDAWTRNTNLYHNDPDSFFTQLKAAMLPQRFFRVHVAGDIIDKEYFDRLCQVVADVPTCRVLMFTKKYEIVNDYITAHGSIPENFQIVFSNWGDAFRCENPYNRPTTEVIFKGEEENPEHHICQGDCTACAINGTGCWYLKNGQTVAFHKH